MQSSCLMLAWMLLWMLWLVLVLVLQDSDAWLSAQLFLLGVQCCGMLYLPLILLLWLGVPPIEFITSSKIRLERCFIKHPHCFFKSRRKWFHDYLRCHLCLIVFQDSVEFVLYIHEASIRLWLTSLGSMIIFLGEKTECDYEKGSKIGLPNCSSNLWLSLVIRNSCV